MMKITTTLLFVFIHVFNFSQEDSVYWATPKMDSTLKENKLDFGFNFGINKTIVQSEGVIESAVVYNKTGLRVGVFGEYSYNNIFSILPRLELSVNNYKIEFNDTVLNTEDYFPMPLSLNFSIHSKFTSSNSNLNPYFCLGPSIKFPVNVDKLGHNTPNKFKTNLTFDFCVGFEKKFKQFTTFPELRYSHGLININTEKSIDLIKLHTLSLVFNIK